MLKAKFLLLASLMSALFVTGVGASELKVGYVNTQRIFRDAPAAQKAAKKLEGEFAKRDQELQRMARQLQGLQEDLEKNAVTMTETQRRNKEKEFGDLSRDFQRKQREFREDLNLRQNEENAAVIERQTEPSSRLLSLKNTTWFCRMLFGSVPAWISRIVSLKRWLKGSNACG